MFLPENSLLHGFEVVGLLPGLAGLLFFMLVE